MGGRSWIQRTILESEYKEDSKTMNRYLLDLMSDVLQMHRASTQMTLGKEIAALEKMPSDSAVINLRRPHSYRGYYCDLAFENDSGTCQAWELLAECKSAIGKVFEGYKGGNYIMKESTPVWIAEYGCSGVKLIALYEGGEYETEDDD